MNSQILIIRLLVSLCVSFLFITGCGETQNPIADKQISTCAASECHISTMLRQYPPHSGKHAEHLSQGYICENCHDNYYDNAAHRNGVNDSGTGNIVYFDYLNLSGTWDNSTGYCNAVACHLSASGQIGWYESPSNECKTCHVDGSSIDPLVTNRDNTAGKHLVHAESKGFTCENCHSGYKEEPGHMNGTYGKAETASIVNFNGTFNGFNGTAVSGAFTDSTGTCNSISCHGYASGIWWYADSSPANIEKKNTGCYTCHSEGSEHDPIAIDSAAGMGRHSKHSGIYCEKCHSSYGTSDTHKNGTLDQELMTAQLVVFDSSNTGGEWINDSGAGTGTCDSLACHPSATLDWYTSAAYTLPECPECHKSGVGSRRQVFDSNGDGSGIGGDFNKISHHVINYASRTTQYVQESDCTACHDQANHMSGIIRLKDYNNTGQVVVYDPAAPSSAEAFCLGCHDTDGANGNMMPFTNSNPPFSNPNPNTLGAGDNIAGTRIKSSWNMQYGHRREGLTCLGTGEPGTGCHGNSETRSINAHGSGNVGLLANQMVLPVPNTTWDATRYKLCGDCHNNTDLPTIEELVRVAPGGNYAQNEPPGYSYTQFPNQTGFVTNGFHDYRAKTYDKQQNLHLYHLETPNWFYRGTTSSTQSCVTCHNVHGVNGRYFYLWDEWRFSIETDNGIGYGKIVDAYFTNKEYPEFCSNSCHYTFDKTYRYPRGSLNEAYAYANRSSGPLVAGDTVTIIFSDPTNGLSIESGSEEIPSSSPFGIDTVFPLKDSLNNSHYWGTISAVWSDSNKRLTITIITPDANPVTVDDIITIAAYQSFNEFTKYDWSILDLNGITYRGKMTIKGSN